MRDYSITNSRQLVRRVGCFSDFFGAINSAVSPFVITAIGSGTAAMATSTALHPGVARFSSSTTANSGSRVATDVSSILMSAGDVCEIGFAIPTTANTTARLGFNDTVTSADATDGVYLEVVGTTASFKSASSSTRTTASNTFTITQGNFYRVHIDMLATADCRVTLFDDTGAVVLAEQSITTNLPTASGRVTGVGAVATNSGTTAVSVLDLDYILYERRSNAELTR